jgi:hypothetical protein
MQSSSQQAREIIKLSRDVLERNPSPGPFIGRKAGDLLKEGDVDGWRNSKDLQPPASSNLKPERAFNRNQNPRLA